jgi:patatin-like phospholipase/acyl hydrolase
MVKKNFKVLSIDGGGIKGLYSAYILKYIQDDFKVDLHDYFDLFCGTSTGGIIALGLAKGVPIDDIIRFYEERGPKIFPYKNRFTKVWGNMKQMLFCSKYSNNELANALKDVFGDSTIGDLEKQVCIPAIKLSNNQITVFKKDHSSGLNKHNSIPIVSVALATSAAPTYFPIVEIEETENSLFIDGGLAVNDPSIIGAIEASKYFINTKNDERFDLLSISSVQDNCGLNYVKFKRKSSLLWIPKIINIIFSVQSNTHYFNMKFLKDILPCNHYFKIPSPELSSHHRACISMDLASDLALKTLKNLANDTWLSIKNSEDMRRFFEKEIVALM